MYGGLAPFHRLTPNKRFEPVFSTVIMAVCSLFNRMLLLTDLIPVHLVYCGQTVMIGCNHTSFEWTRAVRHIYGIIRHMQGLYGTLVYRPFSYCIDQDGLGAFTAKSGHKHNPPPLTAMRMNFDFPNFPSLCSLSAIISFQTCSNKCILYVLLFHKCIKIKYKTVNMYGVFFVISAKFVPLKYYTLSSQLPCSTVECSGRRILSPGQIAIINTI